MSGGPFEAGIKQAITRAKGSFFSVQKSVVATAVLTTATDLTTAATGRLRIVDILLETDSTGLNSTGNAFTITTSGATYGATTVVSQVTSGLGASVSLAISGDTHPTTGKAIVLDAGAKLQFQVAAAAATGAGNLRMTVVFQRIDENADIVSA